MDRSCIHNVDKGPSIECTFDKDGRFPSQPPTYLPKGCDCDRPLRDHKFDCRTNYESRRRERKGLLLRSGELGDLLRICHLLMFIASLTGNWTKNLCPRNDGVKITDEMLLDLSPVIKESKLIKLSSSGVHL